MKTGFIRREILMSLIVKEFKQLFRDKKMRMMLFGAPVLMIVIFGYAVNTDISEIRMAVTDSDMSMQSRTFISRFTSSGYFRYVHNSTRPEETSRLLDSGEADICINIPVDFSRRLSSGLPSEVQILVDGTDSGRASVMMAYINQIVLAYTLEYTSGRIRMIAQNRGGQVTASVLSTGMQERVLFNPDLVSRNFYLPGVLGLLVTLFTVMLTSMAVVKERESGTIDQIIVSPLTPAEFAAGKMLPFAFIGLIDIYVITLLAIIWFGVPFNGSFIFLVVASLFFIMCTLSVGLYISTVSATQQQAMLSTFLFFIPSILLSGFIFPIYAMPVIFRYLTLLNPLRYFISIIRGVFLKGVGITYLWQNLLALTVLGIILIYLSMRRFSRGFE